MSNSDTDTLMNLWRASLSGQNRDGDPPFQNHNDMLATIDAIAMGGAPWQTLVVSYAGPLPMGIPVPSWMANNAEWIVYFRSPLDLCRAMLRNPQLVDQLDYCAYRDFDTNGKRVYKNFMSGDYAFEQLVSQTTLA
jgi:Plavaka transposase